MNAMEGRGGGGWGAAWPSGKRARLVIRWPLLKSRPNRQLAELNSSVTLVNSQLVCLRPVSILNPAMFDLNYLFQMICTAPLA